MSSHPNFDIQEELKKLPAKPGVYLMHNDSDEIIYVGKAIRLKNRVKQYFESTRSKTTKILKMVSHIAWFEYIVTDSELEALVLECNLIKEYRPKYNTMLVDDKSYPYVCVTVQEAFPRVFMTRNVKKDKARYFGPYTSNYAVKETLQYIHNQFKIRTCNRVLPRDTGKQRPCLNYDMGRCTAPCNGYVSEEEYRKGIDIVVRFLDGDYKALARELETKMAEASKAMEFETAIRYRDLLSSLSHFADRQKITDAESDKNRDFIAVAKDKEDAMVSVFFVREGKLLGRDHFHVKLSGEEEEAEILSAFMKQFYSGTPDLPAEIYISPVLEDESVIAEFLTQKRGKKVTVLHPKRGEKEHFLVLAEKNAKIVLDREKGGFQDREETAGRAVRELEALTGLTDIHRMEAFDISNISGFESVGSMVVFVDGIARKNDYRKFRIRTVTGPNDYASMEEVLGRRYSERHLSREAAPDLILMDGGKGQVHVAEAVLRNYGLSIPVVGMVKDDFHRTRGLFYHDVELPIDTHGEAFKLITRIQDEAHRFAITYHRGLHTKGTVKSVLSEIPGVGAKREMELIRAFEDIEAIRKAGAEEIARVPGFNQKVAEEVVTFLHKNEKETIGQ